MKQKVISLGKRITPHYFYPFIYRCLSAWKKQIRNPKTLSLILSYYSKIDIDIEVSEVLNYIETYGLEMQPYEWAKLFNEDKTPKYDSIVVFHDEKLNLPYVLLDEKRLYFPNSMDDIEIKKNYYISQEIEQHLKSPHRYLTDEFNVKNDDIIVDCGSAEGNFSLNVINKVSKIYIFEPEEKWMMPLQATFAPWKDKVVVVQKYLSDVTDEINITLDDFFSDKECPTFLKLDVEGYEERILLGAERLLLSKYLKNVVTCTYHKHDDEEELGTLLRSNGFTTTPSSGYIIAVWDKLYPPYLRRGVIRATKDPK